MKETNSLAKMGPIDLQNRQAPMRCPESRLLSGKSLDFGGRISHEIETRLDLFYAGPMGEDL